MTTNENKGQNMTEDSIDGGVPIIKPRLIDWADYKLRVVHDLGIILTNIPATDTEGRLIELMETVTHRSRVIPWNYNYHDVSEIAQQALFEILGCSAMCQIGSNGPRHWGSEQEPAHPLLVYPWTHPKTDESCYKMFVEWTKKETVYASI